MLVQQSPMPVQQSRVAIPWNDAEYGAWVVDYNACVADVVPDAGTSVPKELLDDHLDTRIQRGGQRCPEVIPTSRGHAV